MDPQKVSYKIFVILPNNEWVEHSLTKDIDWNDLDELIGECNYIANQLSWLLEPSGSELVIATKAYSTILHMS